MIVTGQRSDCDEISYSIHEGANLISYCCKQATPLTTIPEECTAIVGEGTASTYNPTLGWIGNLQEMSPGKGYWIKCSEDIEIQWECEE